MNTTEEPVGVADFFYEVGHLKRTSRTGWALARMTNRESVADHSFRAAVIAMSMASAIGANPDLAATIALLHDLPEARLGDINHLTRRYIDEPKPFTAVVKDQVRLLPPELRDIITERATQWINQSSPEAVIAKDADVLESILHIRESLSDRSRLEDRWVRYLAHSLKTDIARDYLKEILSTDPDGWWPQAVTDGAEID